MELAKKVKKRREEMGLSQEELAMRMGYKSRSSVNKIEAGRPVSQKIIVRLAEALGVTVPYLMGFEDDTTTAAQATGVSLQGRNDSGDTTIEDVIKSLRIGKHLSLSEFSEELGVQMDELQKYENGSKQLTGKMINTIAHFFGLEYLDIAEILLYESGHDTDSLRFRNIHVNRARNWYTEFGFSEFTDEETEQLFQYGRFLLWSRENKQ